MKKHSSHNIVTALSSNIQTQYPLPNDSNIDFDHNIVSLIVNINKMFNSIPHNSDIRRQILKQFLPSAHSIFISFITSCNTSTISKSRTASNNILTSTFRTFKQEVNYLDFKQMETLIDDILPYQSGRNYRILTTTFKDIYHKYIKSATVI